MKRTLIQDRLLKYPIEKTLGCTFAISLFFFAYFWVLQNPSKEAIPLPVLTLDKAIPVVEGSAWVYFSLWVYICIPCCFIGSRKMLLNFGLGSLLLATVGLSIFYFYPTTVPDWTIDWTRYETIAFLKSKDNTGNACPSLHVAYSIFAFGWIHLYLAYFNFSNPWKIANALWSLVIILSTLTTKQHLLIDVFWGSIAGLLAFAINLRWIKHYRIKI